MCKNICKNFCKKICKKFCKRICNHFCKIRCKIIYTKFAPFLHLQILHFGLHLRPREETVTVSSRGLKTLCKFERCKIFAKILHKSKKNLHNFLHILQNFLQIRLQKFLQIFLHIFLHHFVPM